jgi:hypothetical protein
VDARLDGIAALLEGVYRTQLEQQEVLRQVIEGQAELLRRRSSEIVSFSSAGSKEEFILSENNDKKKGQSSFETTGFDKESRSRKSSDSRTNQKNNNSIGNCVEESNTVLGNKIDPLILPVSDTAIYHLQGSAESDGYKHHVQNAQNKHDLVHSSDYRDGEDELYNNTETTLIDSDLAYNFPRPSPCYARNSSREHNNGTDHDETETQPPPLWERTFTRRLVSSDDRTSDDDTGGYEEGYSSDKYHGAGLLNLSEL